MREASGNYEQERGTFLPKCAIRRVLIMTLRLHFAAHTRHIARDHRLMGDGLF